jgi:hypothetical protein
LTVLYIFILVFRLYSFLTFSPFSLQFS